MSRGEEEKPLSRFERFVTDRSTILGVISVTGIFALLYVVLRQTTLYEPIVKQIGPLLEVIWVGITAMANWVFSLIKGFREKVLFKGSTSSVVANKGPKVLLWILDGCSVQAFLDVAERNKDLKTFYQEGYFAQCVTIFPSITPAAHSTIMTGCYPAKTRIPAFDWVDVRTDYWGRETREYVRCMPDFKRFQEQVSDPKYRREFYKGLGDALELNQRFLSPIVYTIFETLGEDWYTQSIKEWIHRGADSFIGVSVNALLEDLARKKIIKEQSMIELLEALFKEVNYEFGGLIWGSDGNQKLADFMVYWKTSTDTKSHEFGPKSPQVREEIDEAIGKLAETLSFYKMHTNQPIYVIITSDHSQSEVTEFSNLVSDFKGEMSGKYRVADREDRALPERIKNANIIVANNDRAAFFYMLGEIGKEAKDTINSYLKGRREVDLILYAEDGQTQVIQVLDDGSSMGPYDIDVFFADKETKYPNAVERIQGLVMGGNWGDIAVSLKEGYSLSPEFRPDKEEQNTLHGDHGGLNYSDSIGPFLIWGPKISNNRKDGNWKTFRTVDIASTVAEIFDAKQKVTDGRILKEVLFQEKER